jgi:acyl-CoA synthetase (AMP-forming)/AMP-acid ligase II
MALLHEVLDVTARWAGARPALQYQNRSTTYRELRERSSTIASGLARIGVLRGERVATYMQNCPEVIEVALACSRVGAICVPLTPLL